jgi:hypothetical protein
MVDDLVERRYVSRYAQETLGLMVYRTGVLADADSDVQATYAVEGGATVFTRAAEHSGTGVYSVTLGASDTQTPANYVLTFSYDVGGVADFSMLGIEVGPAAPAYDALSPGFKALIEAVWVKFADLYDSPLGGPHLQVYMQSHFGRNRLAQLLRSALGRLNALSQPHYTYGLDREFPFDLWGGLLEEALYVEVLKHLVRTYTEQPEVILGTSVSRLDRRDYQQRWMSVLALETEELKEMLDNFRMAHMGLGRVSVLVAGGAYGNYGPQVLPGGAGAAAARGYFFARRY